MEALLVRSRRCRVAPSCLRGKKEQKCENKYCMIQLCLTRRGSMWRVSVLPMYRYIYIYIHTHSYGGQYVHILHMQHVDMHMFSIGHSPMNQRVVAKVQSDAVQRNPARGRCPERRVRWPDLT